MQKNKGNLKFTCSIFIHECVFPEVTVVTEYNSEHVPGGGFILAWHWKFCNVLKNKWWQFWEIILN